MLSKSFSPMTLIKASSNSLRVRFTRGSTAFSSVTTWHLLASECPFMLGSWARHDTAPPRPWDGGLRDRHLRRRISRTDDLYHRHAVQLGQFQIQHDHIWV